MDNNKYVQNDDNNKNKKNDNYSTLMLIGLIILIVAIGFILLYKSSNNKKDDNGGNNIINDSPTSTPTLAPTPTLTPSPTNTPEIANMDSLYPDADLVCSVKNIRTDEGSIMTAYSYVYFNKDGYRTKIYSKAIHKYDNLTDDTYKKVVDGMCSGQTSSCTSGKTEVNEKDFGHKIERNGNTLTVTQYAYRGAGKVATSEFKEEIKQEFIKESGMTCR